MDVPSDPSDCKYDAFKVQGEQTRSPRRVAPLTITKDAAGELRQHSYTWDITKDVDKTRVEQSAARATFNYTVTASHDDGHKDNYGVTGTITVFNPNPFSASGDVTESCPMARRAM